MGLPLAALGLWSWLARGQRRAGLLIACAGFAWSVVSVKLLLPEFRGEESPFYTYYAHVGGSPEGVLKTVFTDPGVIAGAFWSATDFFFVAALAAPLAGLFLLSPGLAAVALPQIAMVGLSSIIAANDPRAHYTSGVIPFIFAGLILGLARLPRERRARLAGLVVGLTLVTTAVAGPWPDGPGPVPRWFSEGAADPHVEALDAAVAVVPDGAAVSSTDRVGAGLSGRRFVYSVPVVSRAGWVVLDTEDPWIPRPVPGRARISWGSIDPFALADFRKRIEGNSDWSKVFEQDGVLVFRRTSSG
jgi:Predicted membrane protein (DUF2079)